MPRADASPHAIKECDQCDFGGDETRNADALSRLALNKLGGGEKNQRNQRKYTVFGGGEVVGESGVEAECV